MKPGMIAKKSRSKNNGRSNKIMTGPSNVHNSEGSSQGYEHHDSRTDNKPRQNGHRNYQQLFDKYMNMARECLTSGDRITAEFHYQYADHYLRLINERNQQQERDNKWQARNERHKRERERQDIPSQATTEVATGEVEAQSEATQACTIVEEKVEELTA